MSADESGRIKKEADGNRIGCNSCAHFYITWNKRYPYGCSEMKFMSSKLPSLDVLEIEGSDCLLFQDKDLDLNNDEDERTNSLKNKNRDGQINVIV